MLSGDWSTPTELNLVGHIQQTNEMIDLLSQQCSKIILPLQPSIAHRLAALRGVVSALTVRRRLNLHGLHARRPASAPELIIHHQRVRLHFAREHVLWTNEEWGTVNNR